MKRRLSAKQIREIVDSARFPNFTSDPSKAVNNWRDYVGHFTTRERARIIKRMWRKLLMTPPLEVKE